MLKIIKKIIIIILSKKNYITLLLTKPKSVIFAAHRVFAFAFTSPSACCRMSKMLSGLMSPWIIFFFAIAVKPFVTWIKQKGAKGALEN